MTKIVEMLKSVFDIITSFFDFVMDFVGDIVKVGQLLAESILNLPTIFGMFLPPAVVGILLSLIGVTVLYRVLGRD